MAPGPYPIAYIQDGKFLNDNHEIGGSLGGQSGRIIVVFYRSLATLAGTPE